MKFSSLTWLLFLFFGSTVLGTEAFQTDNTVGIGNGVVDGSYIGGLNNYDPSSYTVYNGKIPTPTVTVTSAAELKDALKKAVSGNVIYLKDDVEFDLSGLVPLTIPTGVTLCSGRGTNKSLGALLFSNNLNTAPMFNVGSNTKIIGVRLKGPDGSAVNTSEINKAKVIYTKKNPGKKIDTTDFKVYGIPNSDGIMIVGKNSIVEDCEISNWSYAGVLVRKGGACIVEHCYIHHCQRYGLGYGVCLDKGFARIRGNLFDYNRHSIAGSGSPGSGYIADYNVCLPHTTLQGHIFDMHGGGDRKDGTTTAGDSVRINNNLFFIKTSPAIRIRGIPLYSSSVYNNSFVVIKGLDYKPGRFQQNNAKKVQMNPTMQIQQYNKRTLNIHNNNFYEAN